MQFSLNYSDTRFLSTSSVVGQCHCFGKKKSPQKCFLCMPKNFKGCFCIRNQSRCRSQLVHNVLDDWASFSAGQWREIYGPTISYTCCSKLHSSGKFPEANWFMINWPQLWAREKALGFNGPYAWLRQTSKFHNQASFESKILRICTLYAWVFFSTVLPWEFIYAKLRNFIFWKRDLVVKFTRLT